MLKVFAVVYRLPWKSGGEISSVAREDAELSDDVVNRFGTAAVVLVVHAGGVVLHIDAMRHDHRSCHDLLQNLEFGIGSIVVAMEE